MDLRYNLKRRSGLARKAAAAMILVFILAYAGSIRAQITGAGDIAFSGYISQNSPDEFSFVLLKACPSGTVIHFTDNAWLDAPTNAFRSGETTVDWTATAAMPAGTEIQIAGLVATRSGGGAAGTVTGTALSLSSTGDQVLAYLGAVASPTFLSAIHMNVYTTVIGDPCSTTTAAWDNTCANTGSGTALPPGLTNGVNAIWIGTQDVSSSEKDNGHFNCSAVGVDLTTASGVRAALNNQTKWIANDGVPGFTLPTGCNYLGALASAPVFTLQPASVAVCTGTNTSFTITATGATGYQWQVDNGGGYANLGNDATYSGVTTFTLNITAPGTGLNGYLYRCVASNGAGPTNSNGGTLTVNPYPANPTLLAKTPSSPTVADGTPVSATFSSGSGGTGCTEDYRFTTNGGSSYLPYTPGANISTTGLAAGSGFVFIEGRRAACSSSCQGSYTVLASWLVTPLPAGATTLAAGDIAFSGYNSTPFPGDEFSFVLLKNTGPGTVIKFTDDGWQSGVLTSAEETVTWTSNGAYPAGTEIKIVGLVATLANGGGSAGTVTGTALSLSTTGDQVLAYTGTAGSPTFISGIHMNVYSIPNGDPVTTTAAAWDGNAATLNASGLPPGLTTGTNAIWIGTQGDIASEVNNARYGSCSTPGTLGPIATLRSALNNQANWTKDDVNMVVLPTGCPYLGINIAPPNFTLQPANAVVCTGANGTFTITAATAVSYQWQEDNGSGFVNLSNGPGYSGVTTTTLTVIAPGTGLNGYLYRCVATNAGGSVNSGSATLSVFASPVNPSLLAKTPPTATVADGTPVSATFNAGSSGSGCVDDYRYTVNGGTSYAVYTPGANISTTGIAAGSGAVFIEGRRANCSNTCQGTYQVLASWIVTPLPAGATTMVAGDIAFSGYTSTTASDDFSFVLLKNIGPGTVLNFTDNGWLNGTNTVGFRSGESTATWTSNAAYPAGTEIKISGLTATLSGGGSAGTVTGAALSLSTTGDQVLVYQGTSGSPVFISGIHMNVYTTLIADPVSTTAAGWDPSGGGTQPGGGGTTNGSALPPGLTTGVNAIWIGTQDETASEYDNARFGNCADLNVSGDIAMLRAALNNQANWIRDNSTIPGFTMPAGCNFLSGLTPAITETGTLLAFSSCSGSASAQQTFTVSGINLSAALIVTAPADFEVSTTSGTGFGASVSLPQSGGTVALTTIYVRLSASASGTPSGNIVCSSAGATAQNVAVSGTVNSIPSVPIIVAETSGIANNDAIICSGASVSLTASGGTIYSWSTGASTAAINVSPLATTAYTVTVTNAGGCTSSASQSITVNSLPSAAIAVAETSGLTANDGIICNGASATLTASGGTGYAWSTGSTSSAITVSPLSNTTYTVTVTNANNCSATASTTITVSSLPLAAIAVAETSGTTGNDAIICKGSSATLTASGGTGYAWSTGATSTAITVSPLSSTTYTVTVTNANNCTAVASQTITVADLPVASVSVTETSGVANDDGTICKGASATLTASGGSSYNWSTGASTAAITVSPLSTTAYTVTVTNAGGCQSSASVSVTVNNLPSPAIAVEETSGVAGNDGIICNGASATLTASGGTGYAWSTGSTSSAITVSP
ncbi:MAG: hypothetical protein WCK09_12780, partial [Bacteroidota bacterium]